MTVCVIIDGPIRGTILDVRDLTAPVVIPYQTGGDYSEVYYHAHEGRVGSVSVPFLASIDRHSMGDAWRAFDEYTLEALLNYRPEPQP